MSAERASDAEACREAALRLLERSRRTRSGLARKLKERGFDGGAIESVLDRLAAVGLVDDVEYARVYLRERWGRRAAGWRRLEIDLRARGVGAEDIARGRALLEAEQGATDEVAAAARVLSQVARRYAQLEPRVRRQRLWSLLARRGFDGDVIEQALREENESTGQLISKGPESRPSPEEKI